MTSRARPPAALLLLLAAAAAAGPLPREKVPDPLKPWVAWALDGHEGLACPTLLGLDAADDDADAPGCLWGGRLELALDARGGRFALPVRLFREGFVRLPGDARHWPQDVRAGSRPAPVIERDGGPATLLPAGEHALSGAFAWSSMPESLPVPPETGLLSLSLRGRPVPFPVREDDGLLWLQREAEQEEGESRLEVTVHRRLVDEQPMLAVARVKLEVSGKNREVLLGRALLEGFSPLEVAGSLPARLEPDGRLRVQVRPGTFTVEVTGRRDGPVAALSLPPQPEGAPWAPEELWVFEARPALRVVDARGLPQIDVAQTTLADDWKRLPAFRLRPGDRLELAEQRRGDSEPAPDQLSLERQLWLDFDGGGWTARDRLTGRLTRAWRLEMPEPSRLGRVTLGGRDQLITRAGEGSAAGVEVRAGLLDLQAQSRVELGAGRLPAVGWGHDLKSLSAQLQLPPGWRLLHASGADDASETWLQRWSLLDLFLVLMVALAVARMFGAGWGALAFFALGLALPEGAPRWSWLWPLAAEGLLRVVPPGRLARLLGLLRVASWVVLLVLLVPFAAGHLRGGMYPALESRTSGPPDEDQGFAEAMVSASANALAERSPAPLAPPEFEEPAVVGGVVGGLSQSADGPPPKLAMKRKALMKMAEPKPSAPPSRSASQAYAYQQKLDLVQIDPNAVVQTGPGLPSWTWRSVSLRWSGPVERGAQLSLWLLPPAANLALAFLRVGLLAALAALLIVRRHARGGGAPQGAPLATAAAATAALVLLGAPPARAGDLPSDAQLDELRERLTRPPACRPLCADSPRLTVEAGAGQLKLRLELAAVEPVAVPLPGGLAHWTPERVTLDGAPARSLRHHDGALWLLVPAGAHVAELWGALPARDQVQLQLRLRPRRVEARLTGWTLDGLHEDGTVEESLQLSRVQRGAARDKLEPGQLPPWAEVERSLLLGLTWQVETKVTRRSPAAAPVVLEVPLLLGESITSADVRAEKGKAIVSLSPRTPSVTWRSVLSERPALELVAPKGVPWAEVWHLEAAQVWHVEATGIPPVLAEPAAQRVRSYRPYPGEALKLAVSRPAAVPGQTLTVQSSRLVVAPGARSTDATLELKVSGSRGGPFAATLPEGAALQAMALDGATQPLRQEGRKAVFTLPPGEHALRLEWREPGGLSTLFSTPRVDLGTASVNASVELKLPAQRWVLLLGGPRLGPAVLFWSLLVVMTLAGAALARVPLAPLRAHQWVLLAVGLTQVEVVPAAAVAGWLLALGWRRLHGAGIARWWRFDLAQLLLVAWSLAAMLILFASIRRGLLGTPLMQVAGNGSTAADLRWFLDRAGPELPGGWALSVPLLVYRLAMLAWALWLASSLVRWLPWAWGSFAEGGVWRPRERRPKVAEGKAAPVEAAPAPGPG